MPSSSTDGHPLLIPDHRNIVIQKVPQQTAQLGGVSPQGCRRARVLVCDVRGEEMKRMLLLSALTSRLCHVYCFAAESSLSRAVV